MKRVAARLDNGAGAWSRRGMELLFCVWFLVRLVEFDGLLGAD